MKIYQGPSPSLAGPASMPGISSPRSFTPGALHIQAPLWGWSSSTSRLPVRPVLATNSNSIAPPDTATSDVKAARPRDSPPRPARNPGGPMPRAGGGPAAASPPPGTFTRVPGVPVPAAATEAATAAALAASANSANVRVSPRYRPFLDAWDRGFQFTARDEPWGTWLQVTEGEVPPELVGTLFRNGPGRFTRGPDSYRHPYDGDGLVTSVAFPGDGRAFFRSAFVRTAEHEAEDLAGRVLFRGAVSTRRRRGGGLLRGNAGDLTLRNAANAGVVLQGGRLLALYPGGLPYALDPATLTTRGSDPLGGALSPGLPLSLGSPSADAAVSRLHRLFGCNDQLPRESSQLGGDACTARPRSCGVTGRRIFWSHRTLLAGMPRDSATTTTATATTTSPAAGDAGPEAEGEGQGGAREGKGEGEQEQAEARGPGEPQQEAGFDAVAWAGAAARWLRRPPQERFETVVRFWEVEPGELMGPGVVPRGRSGAAAVQPPQPLQPQRQHRAEDELRAVAGADGLAEVPGQQQQQRQWGPGQRQQQQQGVPRRCLEYRVPGFAAVAVHDVAVTANYYLFIQPPVHPEVLPYVLGESGPLGCLRWREGETAVLHVVPRPGSDAERRGERPQQLPLDPAVFVLHHVNAFEDESGKLVLDSVVYDSLPAVGAQPLPEQAARLVDPDAGCKGRLQRLVVDLREPGAGGAVSRRPAPGDPLPPLDPTTSPARHLEFPALNIAYTGRRYRYVYGCSAVFEDASCGVVKADMDTCQVQRWAPGPGYICLEPCFVPRLPPVPPPGPATAAATRAAGRRPPAAGYNNAYPAAGASAAVAAALPPPAVARRQISEDDGWLLVYGFDSRARRSELLVFDAWAIMAGPVARLALPNPLPHGLYGTWTDQYFGPRQ